MLPVLQMRKSRVICSCGPTLADGEVSFGATVTLRDPHDNTKTHTIVGIDELDFEPDAVSWISALGKALLASQLGDRITLEDGRTVKIVKIE